MNRRQLIAALLALPFAATAQSLEIIDLRHRPADDVLPLLEPLLAPGGSISGRGWQLYVRTTPNNLAELRRVLATLDRAPRQLIITVRQDGGEIGAEQSAEGSVVISSRGGASGSIRAGESRRLGVRGSEQTLRVSEGGRALIAIGTAVPFGFQQWLPNPGGGWTVTGGTTYVEAVRGFYVQPQVSGEHVRLEITPQDEQFGRGGAVRGMRLATTVDGRLGEWIALGGASEQAEREGSGALSTRRSTRSTARGVWVRVEQAAP